MTHFNFKNRGTVFSLTFSLAFCLSTLCLRAQNIVYKEHPKFNSIPGLNCSMEGLFGNYVKAIKTNWITKVPETNPAILDMFSVRDVKPYRDYMWWSGEFAGKYLQGAVDFMSLFKDETYKSYVRAFVKKLVALQDTTDGYLGPYPRDQRLKGNWELWNHYHIMLGLLSWYDKTQDKTALNCAKMIGDMICEKFPREGPGVLSIGFAEMNEAIIHGMAILYQHTGTSKYLDFCQQIIKEFEKTGNYVNLALEGQEFYKNSRPRWESLHDLMGIAELYYFTGNSDYKKAVDSYWWSIVKNDRHNNGGFSSAEGASGNPYDPGVIETCATIAWVAFTVEMLKMTGNSVVADELEMSTLNQVLGYESGDGKWCTYNTPMDGERVPGIIGAIRGQSRPGSEELSCCSSFAPRGFGLISEWALMSTPGGLVLNWYGPSKFHSSVNNIPLSITQVTDYPRSGTIILKLEPEKETYFTLQLRIPYWSKFTHLEINGKPVEGIQPGQYKSISRNWKKGDVVKLNIDLTISFWKGEQQSENRVSIYRGPLLLTQEEAAIDYQPLKEWVDYHEVRVCNLAGATAEYRFTGSQFSILGKKMPDGGKAKIEVDGFPVDTINQFSSEPVANARWNFSNFKNSFHTVKITVLPNDTGGNAGTRIYLANFEVPPVFAITVKSLEKAKIQMDDKDQAQLVLKLSDGDKHIFLRDFGTSGSGLKQYKSWLQVDGIRKTEFSNLNPGRRSFSSNYPQ